MINAFKELGYQKLKKVSDEQRQEEFLKALTIEPNEPIGENVEDSIKEKYREIVINLDTDKEQIELKLGKELDKSNRELFFGFELPSPNNSKLYFTTNNWYYHLDTISESIEYIEKNMKKENERYKDFLDYLKLLEKQFYKKEQIDDVAKNGKIKKKIFTYFDIEKIEEYQKEKIKQYSFEEIEKDKSKNKKKSDFEKVKNAIEKFIYLDMLKVNKKQWEEKLKAKLNIFSIKINDKYITERHFKHIYADLVNYSVKERFFSKSKKDRCDICGEEGKNRTTGKIDIPTKFYITDEKKPGFFENCDIKNAHKAFAICDKCYEEVRVGINMIENSFSGRLFKSIDYYIIPKRIEVDSKIENAIKSIRKRLNGNIDKELEKIEGVKEIEINEKNIKLDFLFWHVPEGQPQAFVVINSIQDISYIRFKEVFESLDKINNSTIYDYIKHKPDINSLYFLLFPNKNSHEKKVESKLFRKELVDLTVSVLLGRTIDYKLIIGRFMDIYKKTYFNKDKRETLIFNPLKMNIIFSWINNIANLKGGIELREGNRVIEIADKDLVEFFTVHKDIYGENYYRQGLFLLGKLINEILKKQEEKETKSNFLEKVNLDGIPPRRIFEMVEKVTDALKIYERFEPNNATYSQMMDRLQGVNESKMTKDEVVFYILSGISFGRYLGSKYSHEKSKK